MFLPPTLSIGLCQIASGHADTVVAGGVDFMSDVPIRVSRGMRKGLLAMNKAKTPMDRLTTLAGSLRHFGLEVQGVTWTYDRRSCL